MPSRRFAVVCVLLAGLLVAVLLWRNSSSPQQSSDASAIAIDKQPATLASRTFDPGSAPPPDMPPLSPGDEAECDSNFLCNASVSGQTQPIDATHATVTIEQIKIKLQLNVTIWAPLNAPPNVIEHEEGHRQISQHYYDTADQLAERVAAAYKGKQVDISGTDLSAESSKVLQQAATDITAEFNRQLNAGPTQQLFDDITNHGRNGVIVKDAVASAIQNTATVPIQPAPTPGN